jgi:2-keto-4-pentenoate hydratase
MKTNTTASQAILHAVADALLLAETSGNPIAPISATHPELTIDDAYAIQAINVHSREVDANRPARVAGHKIGLTSEPMQVLLGVDQPDYGVLYDDRIHPTGVELDLSGLIAPRIEPELAFILRDDLPGPGVTAGDVLAATEAIVPALEVIDSRVRDWKITLIDTIADNASCHGTILGAGRHAVADVDLPGAAVAMSVDQVGDREEGRVSDLDEVLQEGVGAAVLGDPAEAVAWLANALAGHGVALKAGHVVLSGSITAAVPIAAGNHVVADFGALGRVEVTAR